MGQPQTYVSQTVLLSSQPNTVTPAQPMGSTHMLRIMAIHRQCQLWQLPHCWGLPSLCLSVLTCLSRTCSITGAAHHYPPRERVRAAQPLRCLSNKTQRTYNLPATMP